MRRAAELSPADWPSVVDGVRRGGHGHRRGPVLAAAGLITALLCLLLLASSAAAAGPRTARASMTGGHATAAQAHVSRKSLRAVRRARRHRAG